MTAMLRALCLFVLHAAPAMADICAPYPWTSDPRLGAPAASLDMVLDAVPSLARPVAELKPTLCLVTRASEAHGTYQPETATISVHDGLSPGETTAILIHELRHLDQSARGICLSPDLAMRDHARAVFALEADAMAVTMLIAWELRETDGGAAFAALRSLPGSADIAATFARTMAETGDSALATADAFTAWYASDTRREKYYVSSCEAYLSEREDSKRLPGGLSFDATILTRMCQLPTGETYPCREPDDALPR